MVHLNHSLFSPYNGKSQWHRLAAQPAPSPTCQTECGAQVRYIGSESRQRYRWPRTAMFPDNSVHQGDLQVPEYASLTYVTQCLPCSGSSPRIHLWGSPGNDTTDVRTPLIWQWRATHLAIPVEFSRQMRFLE